MLTVHFKILHFYCEEAKVGDTDEDVKESLNEVSTELTRRKKKRGGREGIRGVGECEDIDMEKEEKITNVI